MESTPSVAESEGTPSLSRILNSNQKKRATVLRVELEDIVSKYPLGRLVCITLTLPGRDPPSRSECEKRYHSLYTNVLSEIFECGVTVFERSPVGRPHYHLVAVLKDPGMDVRAGFSFEAYNGYLKLQKIYYKTKDKGDWARMKNKAKAYGKTVNDALRGLWDGVLSSASLAKYGFGIAHAVPVKSPKAVAVYYAKYLTKDSPGGERFAEEDKGARTYRIWGSRRRKINLKHVPWNKNTELFWLRLRYVAYQLGFADYEDYSRICGPRWYYYLGDYIQDVPKEVVIMWRDHPWVFENPEMKSFPIVEEAEWWNGRIHRAFAAMFDPEKDPPLPQSKGTVFLSPPEQGEEKSSSNQMQL